MKLKKKFLINTFYFLLLFIILPITTLADQNQIPDPIKQAIRLAVTSQTHGDYSQAKTLLERALSLESSPEQAILIRSHLGDVLLAMQDPITAQKYLDQALELAHQQDNASILAHVLNNRCNLFSVERIEPEASKMCTKAVELAKTLQNSTLYFQALNNQIWHLLQKQEMTQSQTTLETAFSLVRKQPASALKSFQLITLGQLALRIQKISTDQPQHLQMIYSLFDDALQLAEQFQEKNLIAYAKGYLGQLYELAQRYQDALQLTQQAIFFSQSVPEQLYLWEWQRGRLYQAQHHLTAATSAYQRAIELLQPIRTALIIGQRDSRTAFQERIRPVYFSLADVLLQQARLATSPKQKTALLNQARATLEEMKQAELEDYFQEECVVAIQNVVTQLEQLDPHTTVFYPILLPDRIEILFSLPDGLHQAVVPIKAERLEQTVRAFHRHLQISTHFLFIKEADQLYQWLIAPIAKDLTVHHINTLVIVPDGVLRMIPMAALYDNKDKKFLIQKFALATTPSLNLTEPRPLPREHLRILLQGLSESVQKFSPLPFVPNELETIETLFVDKTIFIDKAFSLEKTFNSLKRYPYNIVHIASHGQFNRDPKKTFVLTYEDKLTLNRLEHLLTLTRWRKDPVELLTLSACQTAVGDERAALGLAGIAIKAGARSALASLWFVNDRSTSELVVEFYRQLTQSNLSKAQALQQAQIKLMKQPAFRHPMYWGSFLLIGNWL